MTRNVAKLAPTKVTALLRAGNKGMHADGGNLYLQVTGAGCGSWIFRYSERGSGRNGGKQKTHWLGLGAVHTVTLAKAREKARELRQESDVTSLKFSGIFQSLKDFPVDPLGVGSLLIVPASVGV